MRLQARPVKQAALHDEMRGWSEQANAVAGRIDYAVRDQNVLPVPAGNGIVPGIKLAADDGYVTAGAPGTAAEVNTIPAASDLQVAELDVVCDLKEDGVIGRIEDRNIPDCDAPAIHQI